MSELDKFLAPTKFCDVDNPEIKRVALQITKDCKDDREKAVKLFYWVRDNVVYRFGSWNKKASRVLKDKSGMCTNKSVLLTSLLRSQGIYAGFGILRVKGQEYFGPIAPAILSGRVSKTSVHIYSYVFLNNKWIRIDPSVDIDLSKKTNYFNPTTQLTEWFGDEDATENLDPSHIIRDSGPISNIDINLEKKPRSVSKFNFFIGNLYLDFLRSNEKIIKQPQKDLEPLFVGWLKRHNLAYYILFKIFLKLK